MKTHGWFKEECEKIEAARVIEVKIIMFGKKPYEEWEFTVCGLVSRGYSTKSNAIRGIHRTMRRLGIGIYAVIDENGKRTE